jgi:methanethiol S-methyltransferase
MLQLLIAAYGIAAYLIFLATILYTIAFVGNLPVPVTVDVGPAAPVIQAVAIDISLFVAFAVQHSVMARGAFKTAWTRVVSPVIERSTYVLASSVALAALVWFWRPIAQPVLWDLQGSWLGLVLQSLFWAGWLAVFISSFLINHFELFGLQQIAARLWRLEVAPTEFRTPLLYRHVRHPMYLGFLVAFWATPRMTAGHLLFAIAGTGYILVGVYFEERDLVAVFGQRYRDYQRKVGMLLPWRS